MTENRTLTLTQEGYEDLLWLSETLEFPPQMAAEYAVRLVCACVREGLLTDVPGRAWPEKAQEGIDALRSTGTMGKILKFPDGE